MGAGSLQLACPDDVGLLVEAGLDLDQHHDLLAPLGGPDERLDDRRVTRRPVEGLLDRQHVGVVGGLGDEPLDRGGERLVRVVHQDVAQTDGREHVGRLVLVRRDEARRGDRDPRGGLEVRPVELGDRPQPGQVEHPADVVAVLLAEAESAKQEGPRRGGHGPLHLEADGLAEPSATELLLDRQ